MQLFQFFLWSKIISKNFDYFVGITSEKMMPSYNLGNAGHRDYGGDYGQMSVRKLMYGGPKTNAYVHTGLGRR